MDGHNKHTGDAIIRGEEYTVQLVNCLTPYLIMPPPMDGGDVRVTLRFRLSTFACHP